MKMKKENMEHIRKLVETETGVELPVKEGPEIRPFVGRFLMTAAALLCVAGLGLIWYKVSADKQKDAGAPLASESETEEASLTDNEGNEAEPETEADPETEVENGPVPDIEDAGEETDPETEVEKVPVSEVPIVTIFIVDLADDPSRALVFFTGEDSEIKAEEVRANQTWVWPVKRGGNADGSDVRATDSLMLTKDYYLSIPGAIGEDVHMMHNGEVTDCGFDAEKGNYICTSTEGGFIIEYRHLDEIRAAKGDQLKAGDVIGTLGNSGMSTGPHLGIVVTDAAGNVMHVTLLEPGEGITEIDGTEITAEENAAE